MERVNGVGGMRTVGGGTPKPRDVMLGFVSGVWVLCVGVCGYLGRYSSHIILTVVRERALYTCICSPVGQLLKASKDT